MSGRQVLITCTVVLLALSLGGAASAQPADRHRAGAAPDNGFVHPGVFLSAAQLAHVRTKVDAGEEPWRSAFEQMSGSEYAALDRTPTPWRLVECGSYSNPNLGCSDEREDALAAYTDALMWYLTRDERYAHKAIEIMDAWARTLEGHTNSNAPLQTGWSGVSWSRAGELLRYTYDGWAAADQDRFAEMLRTLYLPVVLPGKPDFNGNWELIMEEAAAGIAVFLDDRASFDQAIEKTRRRVPAYVYLTSDGPLPHPPPGGTKDTPEEIIQYWQGQTRFVSGLAQETCRDFGHTGWGLDAAAHVAETARIQGIDLYGEFRERLTRAYEFHAKYDLGADVPDWLCGGTLQTGLGPTPEVAYNHYHHRLGIHLPTTARLLEELRPTGTDDHFLGWETLTHADSP